MQGSKAVNNLMIIKGMIVLSGRKKFLRENKKTVERLKYQISKLKTQTRTDTNKREGSFTKELKEERSSNNTGSSFRGKKSISN